MTAPGDPRFDAASTETPCGNGGAAPTPRLRRPREDRRMVFVWRLPFPTLAAAVSVAVDYDFRRSIARATPAAAAHAGTVGGNAGLGADRNRFPLCLIPLCRIYPMLWVPPHCIENAVNNEAPKTLYSTCPKPKHRCIQIVKLKLFQAPDSVRTETIYWLSMMPKMSASSVYVQLFPGGLRPFAKEVDKV